MNLSRTTVARALNNNPSVAESTRKMIMDKARELGYVQPSARRAAMENTKEIALLARIEALEKFKGDASQIKRDLFYECLYSLSTDERPDAYICANDTIAESIIKFKEENITLVGDAIVTGFENVSSTDIAKLDGTIEPHKTKIGRLMGIQIYNRIENPDLPHTTLRLNVTPIFNNRLK